MKFSEFKFMLTSKREKTEGTHIEEKLAIHWKIRDSPD